MTARALELPDDGTIALWTSAVEMFNERASELAILQALNSFLSQSLSAEGENPMVRHNQLPERQEKSLSRLRDLDTADGVPNSKNSNEKGDSCASAIRRKVLSAQVQVANLLRLQRPRSFP